MYTLVAEYNDVFGGGIDLPDGYIEYSSAKMTSVESDVESGQEEYYDDPEPNRLVESFGEVGLLATSKTKERRAS